MDFLNLILAYVILSIPALAIVLLFKRKSKNDLEKLNEKLNEGETQNNKTNQ